MPKAENNGRITLANGAWVEIDDALMDMTMDDMAEWVEAEKGSRVREVWPFMAQSVAAWSWELDPKDPTSFGKLTLREYRAVSAAVTRVMQDVSKN